MRIASVMLVFALSSCSEKKVPIVDEATRLMEHHAFPKLEIDAFVKLAHAQFVAKKPSAKVTLDKAIAMARTSEALGPVAMMHAVDVLVAMGDTAGADALLAEALEMLRKSEFGSSLISDLIKPENEPESPIVLDAIADRVIAADGLVQPPAPGTRVWNRIVEKADTSQLVWFANIALWDAKPDLAKQLLDRVVASHLQDARHVSIAELAALVGNADVAKRFVTDPKIEDEAIEYATVARVHALLGDNAASSAAAKRARAATASSKDVESQRWVKLTLALAKIDPDNVVDTAKTELAAFEPSVTRYFIADFVRGLILQGQGEIAERLLPELEGENRESALLMLVSYKISRGELDTARKLAGDDRLTRSAVLDAYAYAGNVAAIRELVPSKDNQADGYLDLAARMLAKQGKCDDAIVVVVKVNDPGPTYAEIAIRCPAAKVPVTK